MNKLELDIKGSEDYLNVVGGFIRHAFFFKKRAFKFVGLRAEYLDTHEQVNVSTILGTELPQAILLRLNTLDLSELEQFVEGDLSNEHINNFTKNFSSNKLDIVVSVKDSIMEIEVKGEFKKLSTSDLRELIGESPKFDIYSSIEARPIDIKLYLRYDYGFKSQEENLRLLSSSKSGDYVTVDTLHKYDCKFGYSVEGEYLPKLTLNLDDRIDPAQLKLIIANTFAEIENSI